MVNWSVLRTGDLLGAVWKGVVLVVVEVELPCLHPGDVVSVRGGRCRSVIARSPRGEILQRTFENLYPSADTAPSRRETPLNGAERECWGLFWLYIANERWKIPPPTAHSARPNRGAYAGPLQKKRDQRSSESTRGHSTLRLTPSLSEVNRFSLFVRTPTLNHSLTGRSQTLRAHPFPQ